MNIKFFNNNKKAENDGWIFWDFYDNQGYCGLLYMDISYLDTDDQRGFTNEFQLNILIPKNRQQEGGWPNPETHKILQNLEAQLKSLLEKNKVSFKQVLRGYYDGSKTMLFEVEHIAQFSMIVEIWESGITGFDIEITEGESWIVYNEMRPDDYV